MVKVRVLVVDDSVLIRRLLVSALNKDPELEVVATANNGRFALAKIPHYNPDVVTMDIEMPEMNGMEALALLQKSHPNLPVIMLSGQTEKAAAKTFDCLELGASDYISKEDMGKGEAAFGYLRETLIPRIKYFAQKAREKTKKGAPPHVIDSKKETAQDYARPGGKNGGRVDAVLIGASTGGPNVLLDMLPKIPENFPVPILIVQHMPPVFTAQFSRNVSAKSLIPFHEASSGELVQPGTGWVAPGDYHMIVSREGAEVRVRTNQEPPENSCRPAVDVLFRSAAKVYGENVLAVILTGMGQDGLRGCEEVVAAGGQVIVQDEATSVVWGMPGYVAQAGLAEQVLPVDKILKEIIRRVSDRQGTSSVFPGNISLTA
ncbi:MAG TPA: chemotaxis response regulator protein-glutamate methylesterase [Nitrospiria bacterium]